MAKTYNTVKQGKKTKPLNLKAAEARCIAKFKAIAKMNHDIDHGNETEKAWARKGKAEQIKRDTDGCFDKPTLGRDDGFWNPKRKNIIKTKTSQR